MQTDHTSRLAHFAAFTAWAGRRKSQPVLSDRGTHGSLGQSDAAVSLVRMSKLSTVKEDTHLTMNVGSTAPPPPLPPRPSAMPELPRLSQTVIGARRKSSAPLPSPSEHPPEPPRRVSSLSTACIDDFETRFQFHSEATFPQPETFSNGKKTYSSVVAKNQTTKPSSPPPPQPPPRPPPR